MIQTDGRPTIANAAPVADVSVTNEGTVFTFRPLTARAKQWLRENVEEDAMYLGDALIVEHRYAMTLADGLMDEGFKLV